MDDELNPDSMFQTQATALLMQIAKGEIDPIELAKRELANRGIGTDGKWAGFDRAAEQWEIK